MANYDLSTTQKVTGTIHVDNFGSTVPVSGSVEVVPTLAWASTTSRITASLTPVKLIGSNAARKSLWISCHGTSSLFLGLGTVSEDKFFLMMEPDSFWEMPVGPSIYPGEVWGFWNGDNGFIMVTEVK